MLVVIYGLAMGHPMRANSDVLLSQVLDYVSELKIPALVAGDLNETTSSSTAFCLAS